MDPVKFDKLTGTTQEGWPEPRHQSSRRVWRMALGQSDVVYFLFRRHAWSVDLRPREPDGVLDLRARAFGCSRRSKFCRGMKSGRFAYLKHGQVSQSSKNASAVCFTLTGMIVPMLVSVVVGKTGPVRHGCAQLSPTVTLVHRA